MKKIAVLFSITAAWFFSGCDTLQNIGTNTSGGVFSLNGTWVLQTTNEGSAMLGSTVRVYPVTGGTLVTLSNNTYCARERDAFWREIKNNGAGGFTLSALAGACSGSAVYRPATITVISNEEIRLVSQTSGGNELVQGWRRVNTGQ